MRLAMDAIRLPNPPKLIPTIIVLDKKIFS